jgi:hypothetical protein
MPCKNNHVHKKSIVVLKNTAQNAPYMHHVQLIIEKVSNRLTYIADVFHFDRNLCKGGRGVEWGWDPCGRPGGGEAAWQGTIH